jgi:23S rRNA (guanosine2251-2'-O)-methyltransferase
MSIEYADNFQQKDGVVSTVTTDSKRTYNELLELRLKEDEVQSTKRHPVTVILDNIRSLYNVGSIFRTADAMWIEELILCGFTPSPPRKEIEKTALGAIHTVPWRYIDSAVSAVKEMKAKGKTCFAVELTQHSRPHTTLTPNDYPCCLVLGNELTGIQDSVLSECNSALEIPMFGTKHSLNVAVAGGIIMTEAVLQYRRLQDEI